MADHPRTILSILDLTAPKHHEILDILASTQTAVEVRIFSTSGTPEHRLLAVADRASVVTPLTELDELSQSRAVVTCCHPTPPWDKRLMDWLENHPEIRWLDLSRPAVAGTAGTPVMQSHRELPEQRSWLHLPDPSLAGPLTVVGLLSELEPMEVEITAFQPCSDFGDEGLQELAAQARARLTGAKPSPGAVLQSVLAFDLAPSLPTINGELERQSGSLFPSLTARIRMVRSGVFFGHTCWMMIQCRKPLRANQVRELLGKGPNVRLTQDPSKARPSVVVDHPGLTVFAPKIVGNRLDLWVAADGDMILGPRMVAETLGNLISG